MIDPQPILFKDEDISKRNQWVRLFLAAAGLTALWLTSLHSYLLFHSLVEIFSILVAFGVFVVVWNSRRFHENGYLLFIGTGFLFVGGIDLLHTLAYKGMGVFRNGGGNLPTQLWIAARYYHSLAFLIAPFFLRRKIKAGWVMGGFSFVTLWILLSIFRWNLFPDCYLEPGGLTAFKRVSEYVISLVLGASAGILLRHRQAFDPAVLRLFVISLLLMVGAELCFTLYLSVYDFFNLLGHLLKLAAFYLIYKAVIETGFLKPYDLLFRDLKESQEMLRRANEELETRVRERTADLVKVNQDLLTEIGMRKKIEEELFASEARFRTLYDEAPVGYHEIDHEGRIVRVNRTELELLGYSHEEMVGRPVWEFVVDQAESKQAVLEKLSGLLPPSRAFERAYRRKDGTILPVLIEDRLLRDAEGNILGIRSTIQDITLRKEAEQRLKESQQELKRLAAQLLHVQENERKELARELHDGLGQILAGIRFTVEEMIRKGNKEGPSAVGPQWRMVLSLVQEGIEETRRIQMALRPSILDDLGIVATLNWFCREFEKVYSGIRIEKQVDLREEEVPDSLKTVVYRIVQEALNNISKHSAAKNVKIHLSKEKSRLELRIEDDGQGFDPSRIRSEKEGMPGFGLTSMKERTELSGGAFTITSAMGKGTQIRASWSCLGDFGPTGSGRGDSP